MGSLFAAVRSLVYASIIVFAFGWIALRSRALDPQLGGTLPEWTRPPGVVLMIAGATLALVCAGTFVTLGHGTPAPFDPPREFVAVGPYRWSRNPMAIGALTLLFGFGLTNRSPGILGLAVVVTLALYLLVTLYEEPGLKRRFGSSYEQYLESTPRWIPRFW
ncbi:MAG: isoprenylcysteine carboxylmethyltransferase family protein [Gemmatimonadota bacterium]